MEAAMTNYEPTFEELKEKLSKFDEVTLLEELEIDSKMLVEAFSDIIEEKQEILWSIIE
jgi:hypothetical protein